MRKLGLVLVLAGVSLIIFAFFSFFKNKSHLISPVPDERGINVIYTSPSK